MGYIFKHTIAYVIEVHLNMRASPCRDVSQPSSDGHTATV